MILSVFGSDKSKARSTLAARKAAKAEKRGVNSQQESRASVSALKSYQENKSYRLDKLIPYSTFDGWIRRTYLYRILWQHSLWSSFIENQKQPGHFPSQKETHIIWGWLKMARQNFKDYLHSTVKNKKKEIKQLNSQPLFTLCFINVIEQYPRAPLFYITMKRK